MTYDLSELPPLANGEREIIQGIGTDGDCSFTHTFTAAPDFRGQIVRREMSYDPATCRALFETGTLPLDDDPGAKATAQRSSIRDGQWTGYWRDPVNYPVNWNRSKLRWSYDISTNRVTQVYTNSCPYYRLTLTGWSVSYDSGCINGYQNNQSEYKVESSRTFQNTTFPCTPFPIILRGATTTIHDHELVGTGSGSVQFSTNMGKSGLCSWLLWSETILILS